MDLYYTDILRGLPANSATAKLLVFRFIGLLSFFSNAAMMYIMVVMSDTTIFTFMVVFLSI